MEDSLNQGSKFEGAMQLTEPRNGSIWLKAVDSLGQSVFPSSILEFPLNVVQTKPGHSDYAISIKEYDNSGRPVKVQRVKTGKDLPDTLESIANETANIIDEGSEPTQLFRVDLLNYRYDLPGRLVTITTHSLDSILRGQEIFRPERETRIYYDKSGRLRLRTTAIFQEQEKLGDTTLWTYHPSKDGLKISKYDYKSIYWEGFEGVAFISHFESRMINQAGKEFAYVSYYTNQPLVDQAVDWVASGFKSHKSTIILEQDVRLASGRRNLRHKFDQSVEVPRFLLARDVNSLIQGKTIDSFMS